MIWSARTTFGGYDLEATGEDRDDALALLAAGFAKWAAQRCAPESPPTFADWCEGGEVTAAPLPLGACLLSGDSLYAGELPDEWPTYDHHDRRAVDRAEGDDATARAQIAAGWDVEDPGERDREWWTGDRRACPRCGSEDVGTWGETPEQTDHDVATRARCEACKWEAERPASEGFAEELDGWREAGTCGFCLARAYRGEQCVGADECAVDDTAEANVEALQALAEAEGVSV